MLLQLYTILVEKRKSLMSLYCLGTRYYKKRSMNLLKYVFVAVPQCIPLVAFLTWCKFMRGSHKDNCTLCPLRCCHSWQFSTADSASVFMVDWFYLKLYKISPFQESVFLVVNPRTHHEWKGIGQRFIELHYKILGSNPAHFCQWATASMLVMVLYSFKNLKTFAITLFTAETINYLNYLVVLIIASLDFIISFICYAILS